MNSHKMAHACPGRGVNILAVPLLALMASGGTAQVLEEIVVTAQKRESTIQDAPFSLSALSGSDMAFRSVNSATDLQFQVAGMNVSDGTATTLITIRGVGTNVDSGQTEPAVAVHIDGVYQPRPTTGPLGLYDLERVEVLKGPQGTLYGRNATGGVVNYILRKPTPEFEGQLKVGAADFGRRSALAIVSGPLLGEWLLGRAAIEWDEQKGYVRDVTSGELSDGHEGYGGRLALSWLPSEAFTVDLSLLYRDDEGRGVSAPRDVCLAPPDPETEMQVFVAPPTDPDDCLQGEPYKRKITPGQLSYGERDTLNAALTAVWDIGGDISLKSVTGYQDHEFAFTLDYDETARDLIWVPDIYNQSKSFSEELSAFGSWGRLDWLVGAFYFDSEFIPGLRVLAQAAGGVEGFQREVGTTQSEAVFFDLTYALSDHWRIGGGARAMKDEKEARQTIQWEILENVIPGGLPLPGTIPGALVECQDEPIVLKFDEVTPKFNVQWDVSEAATLYANYSVGFQSGGTNYNACGDTYEPEQNTSVELGFKSSWFGRRLTANGSVFQNAYENLQVQKVEGFSTVIINAPRAKIRGAELELTALLTERFMINGSVSLLDAFYEEFCDQDPAVPDNREPQDCPTGEPLTNLDGVELTRSPDYTVNLGAEYTWELPFELLRHLRVRIEWFKTADQVYRPYGSPHDGQEGFTLVNGFIALSSADESLELRVAGKNLQETEYFLYKIGNSFGQRYGTAGEPRRLGAELVYRF